MCYSQKYNIDNKLLNNSNFDIFPENPGYGLVDKYFLSKFEYDNNNNIIKIDKICTIVYYSKPRLCNKNTVIYTIYNKEKIHLITLNFEKDITYDTILTYPDDTGSEDILAINGGRGPVKLRKYSFFLIDSIIVFQDPVGFRKDLIYAYKINSDRTIKKIFSSSDADNIRMSNDFSEVLYRVIPKRPMSLTGTAEIVDSNFYVYSFNFKSQRIDELYKDNNFIKFPSRRKKGDPFYFFDNKNLCKSINGDIKTTFKIKDCYNSCFYKLYQNYIELYCKKECSFTEKVRVYNIIE